jgi:hypothetical protein
MVSADGLLWKTNKSMTYAYGPTKRGPGQAARVSGSVLIDAVLGQYHVFGGGRRERTSTHADEHAGDVLAGRGNPNSRQFRPLRLAV